MPPSHDRGCGWTNKAVHGVVRLLDGAAEGVRRVEPLFGAEVWPDEVAQQRADPPVETLGLPTVESHRVGPQRQVGLRHHEHPYPPATCMADVSCAVRELHKAAVQDIRHGGGLRSILARREASMSDSLRCPFCGWTAAARPTRVVDDSTDPGKRGSATLPTDRYECEVCRQVWDERTQPQAAGT
jgi:hypothetical protein